MITAITKQNTQTPLRSAQKQSQTAFKASRWIGIVPARLPSDLAACAKKTSFNIPAPIANLQLRALLRQAPFSLPQPKGQHLFLAEHPDHNIYKLTRTDGRATLASNMVSHADGGTNSKNDRLIRQIVDILDPKPKKPKKPIMERVAILWHSRHDIFYKP